MTLKPNFKVLGPKYGKGVQAIAKALASADAAALKTELEVSAGSLQVEASGETYTLAPSEVDVQTQNREGFFVEMDAKKFVALSTELSPETEQGHKLILEGMARELVNKIQNVRKVADYNVSNRITLSVVTESKLVKEAFETHRDYILTETLTAEVVESVDSLGENAFILDQNLNGEPASLGIDRVFTMARELVNKIQNMRKVADYNVSNRITLSVVTESKLVKEAFETHRDYILTETLTAEVVESVDSLGKMLSSLIKTLTANLQVWALTAFYLSYKCNIVQKMLTFFDKCDIIVKSKSMFTLVAWTVSLCLREMHIYKFT